MKKLFVGFFAVVLVLSLSAYHWSAKLSNPVAKQTDYTWYKYNQAGDQELFPAVTFYGTATEAAQEFDCPDGATVICARAYDGTTPLDIYVLKNP